MYLGKQNFPEAGDLKKEDIDKMQPDSLPDLIQHLQMQLEKCFGQHGAREKNAFIACPEPHQNHEGKDCGHREGRKNRIALYLS